MNLESVLTLSQVKFVPTKRGFVTHERIQQEANDALTKTQSGRLLRSELGTLLEVCESELVHLGFPLELIIPE